MTDYEIINGSIPLMKTMRVDKLNYKGTDYYLLVDQLTNKIYYSALGFENSKIKNIYKEFRYGVQEMQHLYFYVPFGMVDRIVKLKVVRYQGH